MSGVSHLVLENVGIENQESFGQAVTLEHLQTPERLSAWHTSSQPANVTVPYDVPDAACIMYRGRGSVLTDTDRPLQCDES